MSLKFDLVDPRTEEIELVLPPIYAFSKVNNGNKIDLDFTQKTEIKLDKAIPLKEGRIIINKAWLEEERVFISYHLEKVQDTGYQDLLPHFVLIDEKGEKHDRSYFSYGKQDEISFFLYNPDNRKLSLTLDSLGELIPRQKYTIDISEK